ncbi:MAG: VPLPA-CTERM sorting domain-containing protein [Pseudomonadota bacterium]
MLRVFALIAALAAFSVPATAAVTVAPGDNKTFLSTEAFLGTAVSGAFKLTQDMSNVVLTVSGNELPSLNVTSVKLTNGVDIDLTVVQPVASTAFAFFSGPLAAGMYTVTVNGDFANAGFSGEISAVPLPGALVLLGSGLAGLAYMRRRRAAA